MAIPWSGFMSTETLEPNVAHLAHVWVLLRSFMNTTAPSPSWYAFTELNTQTLNPVVCRPAPCMVCSSSNQTRQPPAPAGMLAGKTPER
jgi:hypothetical protein